METKKIALCLGLSFSSAPVWAAGPPQLDLLTTFGSLLVVLGIIFGLAWLLKKMRLPAIGSQKGLTIIKQISVGTRERVAVVKAGEEQFLIGITPHTINLISRLDTPIEEEQVDPGQFANQLGQLLKKNEKK